VHTIALTRSCYTIHQCRIAPVGSTVASCSSKSSALYCLRAIRATGYIVIANASHQHCVNGLFQAPSCHSVDASCRRHLVGQVRRILKHACALLRSSDSVCEVNIFSRDFCIFLAVITLSRTTRTAWRLALVLSSMSSPAPQAPFTWLRSLRRCCYRHFVRQISWMLTMSCCSV